MIRLALIGDLHGHWSDSDTIYFNRSRMDAILIAGDLPGRAHRDTLEIASRLARLTKPAFLMPGNHDGVSIMQLIGEIHHQPRLIQEFGRKQMEKVQRLEATVHPVQLVGFSRHTLSRYNGGVDLIATRPHSMGGTELSFVPYLKKRYGVQSLADSAAILRRLIDESRARHLIFLGHNGPAGLGSGRTDIWGCDFQKEEGDFGDPDYKEALDYALSQKREILAVLGGHMHLHVRGGGNRHRFALYGGIPCVNAALVPRIFTRNGREYRHHVEIATDRKGTEIYEVYASDSGEERILLHRSGANP